MSLVDAAGNPALIEKPLRVSVSPRSLSEASSGTSPSPATSPARGARRPEPVSKMSTSEPLVVVPRFDLDMKLQASTLGGRGGRKGIGVGSPGGGGGGEGRAAGPARDGAALCVRAECPYVGDIEEVTDSGVGGFGGRERRASVIRLSFLPMDYVGFWCGHEHSGGHVPCLRHDDRQSHESLGTSRGSGRRATARNTPP